MMSRPLILKISISILVIVVVLALKPVLQSLLKQQPSSIQIVTLDVSHCLLPLEPCILEIGNSRITIQSDDPVSFSSLSVNTSGLDQVPESATLRIEGKDMFMGIVDRRFEHLSKNDYKLEGLATPACTIDPAMTWLYQVTLNFRDRKFVMPFEVANDYHNGQ